MGNIFKTLFILVFTTALLGCKEKKQTTEITALKVPDTLKWSERMMLSEMERNPEAWSLDFVEKPKWEYTHGLILLACQRLNAQYPNPKYDAYVKAWYNQMIDDSAHVKTYKQSVYNIDRVKPGNALIGLYNETKNEKYLKVIHLLREQLSGQPRTSEGGFWHKKVYPYQMWLDGLYMGEPFYAQYTNEFDSGESAQKAYDDIVLQFDLIQKHSKDSVTGLLYHGWDESKEQAWANKETGTSPHFWGRAMGWYMMALVDVLDYFPKEHPGYQRLVEYLNEESEVLLKYRDQGLWYQVLDQGGEEGNYLEASASSMFVYAFAKGANKGYLPEEFKNIANDSFQAMIKQFVTVDGDGIVSLNQVCGVAGLGGNPYRDGSYEYYVNELIRSNDPKGVGPFIMAALELDK
ncbi:MAG: glycoside hydrolase family 88 protein [Flavobacteriaceae bacterium]|nr:glycoside hydrolase family 88 protein [Mangrovimonas sp.]MCB0434471.1 glycoside hydrolase family 88 protein [Mangrovimonas sp.]